MIPESEPWTPLDVAKGLASALGAVALYIARGFKKQVDDHAAMIEHHKEKLAEIPVQYVSRDTHQKHERDTKDAIDDLRREAVGREDRIVSAFRDEFRELRARIDKVLDERPQR